MGSVPSVIRSQRFGIRTHFDRYSFVRSAEGNVRRFIRTENGVHFDKDMPKYDLADMVPIEARAGSVVLLDGSLIHMR